ncbi:flagellar hook-length control protein FliK [Paracidobacterium acidisoli]|nr:flagellar hook-length control protein FliK [Paracidobacterium acidisoli]MBT9330294.1 flagellar hook-length control protein FliK [Paracidobacterium acidisoli]
MAVQTAATAPGHDATTSVNPYDRMDQHAGTDSAAILLHSTPQSVTVGVRDPALGWTEIHAQSQAGQVSALLTTASTAAHASLASHLTSLSQFLSDHNVAIGNVAVQHGWSQSAGAGTNAGNGGTGNAPHSHGQGGGAGPDASRQAQAAQHAGQPGPDQDASTPAAGNITTGTASRIRVVA